MNDAGDLSPRVRAALTAALGDCARNIAVSTQGGQVCLDGSVKWRVLRQRAVTAACEIPGVVQVINRITLKPDLLATDVQSRIEQAFRNYTDWDASQIHVAVDGSDVTLSGRVRTRAQQEQAREVAWSTPGVICVFDELAVGT